MINFKISLKFMLILYNDILEVFAYFIFLYVSYINFLCWIF